MRSKKKFFLSKLVVFLLFLFVMSGSGLYGQQSGPIRIMPLGDSITLTYDTSWRYELWKLLDADGYDITYVGSVYDWFDVGDGFPRNHEGHGGWTINGIIDSFDELVSYEFDVVLVHLGTNDIWGGSDTPDIALSDLVILVDKIRTKNPNAVIVLAQIIPTNIGRPDFAVFSQRIPEVAALKTTDDSPVYTADLFTAFDVNTGLTDDGVHPTTEGFVMMGEAFYNDVEPVLRAIKAPTLDDDDDDEDADFEVNWSGSSWENGFAGSVTITNNTDQTIYGWKVEMEFKNGEEVSYCWNTNFSQTGNVLSFENLDWNGTIAPGGTASFGFQGTHPGVFMFPDDAVVIPQ